MKNCRFLDWEWSHKRSILIFHFWNFNKLHLIFEKFYLKKFLKNFTSIHIASTGPSKTSQICSFSLALWVFLQRVEKIPSVQSFVATSRRPNICGAVMAFGFIRISLCGIPCSVKDLRRVLMQVVLPAPEIGQIPRNPYRTPSLYHYSAVLNASLISFSVLHKSYHKSGNSWRRLG